MNRLASVAIAAAQLTAASASRAEPGWSPGNATTATLDGEVQARDGADFGDGVYGRLDGDLTTALYAGLAGWENSSYAAVDASLHYFWTAGAQLSLREGLSGSDRAHARMVGLGVDLRPLFLPRLALDLEGGPAWLDLTLDSLSLGVGAYFAKPRGGGDGTRGLSLSSSLAVPFFRSASGPWLRVRVERHLASDADDPSETLIALQLSWHGVWASPRDAE